MKDEELANMIYQAKENRELIQTLINRFQPLINYYCKKLFFLESDDAKQELYLAIIESIKSIPYCETDGQCITYISNAIKFKYCFLCKKNLTKEKVEDCYAKCEEEIYIEDYKNVELRYDLSKIISKLPEKQGKILQYALNGYSDIQIAEVMGVSRQYVNRIRKQVSKMIYASN